MIYELSFRDLPDHGGAVVPGHLIPIDNAPPPARSEALYHCNEVTFIIHGFNVSEKKGRESLTKLAKILDNDKPDTAVVIVLWPGDSPIGPISYPFSEGKQAIDTAMQLSRFIEDDVGRKATINIVAHSLGCQVALETVLRLSAMAADGDEDYPIAQICLFAAAVDDFSLSMPKRFKHAVSRAQRVLVLSSKDDSVLKFMYPIGDLIQSFTFLFRDTAGLALGYHGPRDYKHTKRQGGIAVDKTRHKVADNVLHLALDDKFKVSHSDYFPPEGNLDLNNKQQATARIAQAALQGLDGLQYQL